MSDEQAVPNLPQITDDEIKRPEFQWLSIDELKPYPNNNKIHSEDQIRLLMHALVNYGWKRFPVVEKNSRYILAGHGIIEAAKRLGLRQAPCTISDDTDENHRGYRLFDNKSAELSEWDDRLVNIELVELDAMGFNVGLTGFSDEELKQRIEGYGGATAGLTDDDEVPAAPEIPITKPGDIYRLGDHRLLCGDATVMDAVITLMDGQHADLIFTDPPYNVDYEGYTDEKLTIKNDKMDPAEFKKFLLDTFGSYRWAIKDGGSVYVCHPSSYQREFQDALESCGFAIRCQIIWAKNTFAWGFGRYKFQHEPIFYAYVQGESDEWYGDKSQSTLWQEKKPAANRLHPTMKPVELVLRAIENSSKAGDLVLDLFGGSGTTMIAAEKTKRRCFMAEVDPVYCDVIVKRWENFTGQKAERLEAGA